MSVDRIALLESYLKEDPSDAFSKYALSLEHAKLENIEMAIRLLCQLKAEQADYLPLYYQLGKLYESNNQQDNARSIYKYGIIIAQKQNNRHTLSELKQALSEISDADYERNV